MIRYNLPRGSSISTALTNTVRRHVQCSVKVNKYGLATTSMPELRAAIPEQVGHADGSGNEPTSVLSKPCRLTHLPLSPLMDPEVIAAKEKWHQPKQPPSKTPTAFQLQLARNPYAQALASPMRQCQLTKITLPRYFLQDYNVVSHPETGRPYYMPRSLIPPVDCKNTNESPDSVRGVQDGEGDVSGSIEEALDTESSKSQALEAEALEAEALEAEAFDAKEFMESEEALEASGVSKSSKEEQASEGKGKNLPASDEKVGPSVYLLARQDLLRNMQTPKGFKYSERRFGGQRILWYGRLRAVLLKTVWRSDMEDLVLELMRRRAMDSLIAVIKRRKGYIIPRSGWEQAKAQAQTGAILSMGNDEKPPEFATLSGGKDKIRKIPVHNLRFLFGDKHFQRLKEQSKVFNNELLAIRHRRHTVELQLKLWKLQGYLAEHRPP